MRRAIQRSAGLLRRHWKIALVAGAGTVAGAAVFAPRLVEMSESPEFCAQCHQNQNGDWLHSAHRRVKCIDCHLPNDTIADHYVWKAIDGGKDLFLHITGMGDGNDTELTSHGRLVLQANCIRCHADMVSRMDTERSCTDCHRPIRHGGTARIRPREETPR